MNEGPSRHTNARPRPTSVEPPNLRKLRRITPEDSAPDIGTAKKAATGEARRQLASQLTSSADEPSVAPPRPAKATLPHESKHYTRGSVASKAYKLSDQQEKLIAKREYDARIKREAEQKKAKKKAEEKKAKDQKKAQKTARHGVKRPKTQPTPEKPVKEPRMTE